MASLDLWPPDFCAANEFLKIFFHRGTIELDSPTCNPPFTDAHVQSIAAWLKKAGLPTTEVDVVLSEIKPDSPKWPAVLGRVNITIGHSKPSIP